QLAAQRRQRLGARWVWARGWVGGGGNPGVGASQDVERQAAALEQVMVGVDRRRAAVRVAELDGVGVDDVLAGRRRAPGVLAPPSELHVEIGAGEGRDRKGVV